MATSAELWELKRRRPFHPFRLHLKDGRSYHIPVPACILPIGDRLSIGTPLPDFDGQIDPIAPVLEDHVRIPVDDVAEIEVSSVTRPRKP